MPVARTAQGWTGFVPKRPNTPSQGLEEANKSTIDLNPKTRLSATIRRLNDNLENCGATIDGKEALTPEELEQEKFVFH